MGIYGLVILENSGIKRCKQVAIEVAWNPVGEPLAEVPTCWSRLIQRIKGNDVVVFGELRGYMLPEGRKLVLNSQIVEVESPLYAQSFRRSVDCGKIILLAVLDQWVSICVVSQVVIIDRLAVAELLEHRL